MQSASHICGLRQNQRRVFRIGCSHHHQRVRFAENIRRQSRRL